MFTKLLSEDKEVLGGRETSDKLGDTVFTINDSENIQERNGIFSPEKNDLNVTQTSPENTNSILDVLDNKDYIIRIKKLTKDIFNHLY